MNKEAVAIVLPVYGEEEIIRESLRHFSGLGASELIVVDGGSQDGTSRLIRNEFPNVRLLLTQRPERAFQMNVGAFEACSSILLFVHADMRLPQDAIYLIREAIQNGFVGGGFAKRFDCETRLLCLARMFMNSFYLGSLRRLVGTNAIFVKKEVFKDVDGFPEVPILEDVIFSSRLKKTGRIAKINRLVMVSSRRYQERGALSQLLTNLEIMIRFYLMRQDPSILYERYHRFERRLW